MHFPFMKLHIHLSNHMIPGLINCSSLSPATEPKYLLKKATRHKQRPRFALSTNVYDALLFTLAHLCAFQARHQTKAPNRYLHGLSHMMSLVTHQRPSPHLSAFSDTKTHKLPGAISVFVEGSDRDRERV